MSRHPRPDIHESALPAPALEALAGLARARQAAAARPRPLDVARVQALDALHAAGCTRRQAARLAGVSSERSAQLLRAARKARGGRDSAVHGGGA